VLRKAIAQPTSTADRYSKLAQLSRSEEFRRLHSPWTDALVAKLPSAINLFGQFPGCEGFQRLLETTEELREAIATVEQDISTYAVSLARLEAQAAQIDADLESAKASLKELAASEAEHVAQSAAGNPSTEPHKTIDQVLVPAPSPAQLQQDAATPAQPQLTAEENERLETQRKTMQKLGPALPRHALACAIKNTSAQLSKLEEDKRQKTRAIEIERKRGPELERKREDLVRKRAQLAEQLRTTAAMYSTTAHHEELTIASLETLFVLQQLVAVLRYAVSELKLKLDEVYLELQEVLAAYARTFPSTSPTWEDLGVSVDTDLLKNRGITLARFASEEPLDMERLLAGEDKLTISILETRRDNWHWRQHAQRSEFEALLASLMAKHQALECGIGRVLRIASASSSCSKPK